MKFYRIRPQRSILLSLAGLVLLASAPLHAKASKQFSDYYELEPFQVTGQEIPITVFARSSGDRSYATRFAHKVVEVAYRTLEASPGSGLVIIGKSGEPHPITLFERFLEIAKAEDASPELMQIAKELEAGFAKWREKISFGSDEQDEDMPIDVSKLIDAFPMPLPSTAAQLYLLAWQEEFESERVDELLGNLQATDLQQADFQEFEWVFYLPPRNTMNKVLKEALPMAFEAGELGPMKRMLARAAVATLKPLIKDAFEGVRKGVLYWSILSANEEAFNGGDVEALAAVYIESQMPRGKIIGGDKTERGIEAVEQQKLENEEYAKDPYVSPVPLDAFDAAAYSDFLGRYGDDGYANRRFFQEDGSFFWQKGEHDPVAFLPAGETLLVSADGEHTLRFIPGETPSFTKVELRRERFRHTFHRLSDVELTETN